MVGAGVRGAGASGLPLGFQTGFQGESVSQRMGVIMEAMALVMWVKSIVESSSEGWW